MVVSVPEVKGLALPAVLVALLAVPGCVDIIGSDLNKYVERDEKHFAVSGKPDVTLTTFDGSIEIRPWDKADVQVVIEKRGRDKDDVAAIEVKTSLSSLATCTGQSASAARKAAVSCSALNSFTSAEAST